MPTAAPTITTTVTLNNIQKVRDAKPQIRFFEPSLEWTASGRSFSASCAF
jgi:hypothetical protein